MEKNGQVTVTNTFMGIEVASGVTKGNILFLFLLSFVCNWVMTTGILIRPAFLKGIIGIPDAKAGVINSTLHIVASAGGVIFTILVGALSDRFGRKPLLLIGFLASAFMYIIYGYTKTIANFMGITSLTVTLVLLGVISLIFAVVMLFTWPQLITLAADYTVPKSRGRIMAIQGMMMGISAIILFGVLGQLPKYIGIMPMFFLGASFAFLCFLFTTVGLTEKMRGIKEKRNTWEDIKELFRELNRGIELKVGYLNILSGRADIGFLSGFVVLWMVTVCQKYGYTPAEATTKGAMVLAIMSISIQPLMPVIGTLVDRWGRIPTMIITLIVGGVAICLLGLIENPFSKSLWLVIIFCGIAFAGGLSAQALVSDSVPPRLVGTALGGLNTSMVLGGVIFAALGGLLFDKVGHTIPFVVKGAADVLIGLWVFSVRKRIKDLGRKGEHGGVHH